MGPSSLPGAGGGTAWTRGLSHEPPPPALRRCIFGPPPTTSEPCAFSARGPSSWTPSSPFFLRPAFFLSRASRILAFRSSLAPDMAPPLHESSTVGQQDP